MVPVFSKQILRNGGNYIVIGSVQSVVFVAQFISKDVIVGVRFGKGLSQIGFVGVDRTRETIHY